MFPSALKLILTAAGLHLLTEVFVHGRPGRLPLRPMHHSSMACAVPIVPMWQGIIMG